MKFNIYAKKQDKLIRIYEINRNNNGLYFNDFRDRGNHSYLTYHSDGAYWVRSGSTKIVKKRREPLANIRGAYTLSTGLMNISVPPTDSLTSTDRLRKDDIVVEYLGNFGIEIILCDKPPAIKPLESRPNSKIFTRGDSIPFIVIEFFENEKNVLPIGRFEDVPTSKISYDQQERI